MEDKNSTLKHYLSQLDKAPLLSREEELKLLTGIEKCQNQIISDCLSSSFFRAELCALLQSQSLSDIVKISKKLNDDSTKKDVTDITNKYVELVEALDKDIDAAELISEVALSGNLINSLVNKLKKKYLKIIEAESSLKRLLEYFELREESELEPFTSKLKEDKEARAFYARKFHTNESRLLARIHDYEEYLLIAKSLEDQGITKYNISEIKELYKSITKSEFNMKRFKDELIEKNLRLVVSRAKRFINRGLDFEDLLQEGNIGLIKAINKHDASRGTKVGTYATWWIDQSIRRAISNKSKTVRIPTHIEFFQSTLASTISELTQELGRAPKKEEIAERAKVDVKVLEKLERVAMHKIGIEEEMPSGMTLLDMLPADTDESPFNLTAKKMMRQRIRQILGTLNPRTEKIIRLRFGIGEPHEEMTLQQIADDVGLTKMGVKLVQNKGLKKLSKREELDES